MALYIINLNLSTEEVGIR